MFLLVPQPADCLPQLELVAARGPGVDMSKVRNDPTLRPAIRGVALFSATLHLVSTLLVLAAKFSPEVDRILFRDGNCAASWSTSMTVTPKSSIQSTGADLSREKPTKPLKHVGRGTSGATEPQRTPRILCIDDDPDISYAIELRLRAYDVEWVWAYFGTQGIGNCVNARPDIVLLDYNLPQGRGDEVLQALKHHGRTWDIPVVILSGQPNIQQELFELGADSFVAKPLNFDLLLAELSRFIDLRPLDAD